MPKKMPKKMPKSRYVLYLNLWGTTAKHLTAEDEGLVFDPARLAECQTHFREILEGNAPTEKTLYAIDYALLFSDSAAELAQTAQMLFQKICERNGAFVFWPLRAAIASDQNGSSFAGHASVLAGLLEKSGQKGFRLFASEEVGRELSDRAGENFRLRPIATRGLQHFELNWMTPDFLQTSVAGSSFRHHYNDAIARLFEVDGNYYQQMAGSLADLMRWTELTSTPQAAEKK